MKNTTKAKTTIVVKRRQWDASWKKSTQPEARNWEITDLWYDKLAKRRQRANKNIRGPFTVLNRTTKGGLYPQIKLKNGTMEYFVVSGSFCCNGERFGKGDYVVYRKGSVMNWSSTTGGLMLIVLRGDVVKMPAQPKPNSLAN